MARLSMFVLCAILIGCTYGASVQNVRKRSLDLAASLKRLAEKRDLHPLPKAIDLSKQLAGRAVQNTVSKRLADVNHARRSLSADTEPKSLHARAVETLREFGKKATGTVSHKDLVARAVNKVRAAQKDFARQAFHPAFMGIHRVARNLHNTVIRDVKAKLPK